MFKTVPMMRLSAVLLDRDERILLRELGHLRVVQLTAVRMEDGAAPLPPRGLAREILRCDQLRSRAAVLRRNLGMSAQTRGLRITTLTLDQAEAMLSDLEKRCQNVAGQREVLERRWKELDGTCSQLEGFREIPLALDELGRLDFLHCVTGSLPDRSLNLLPLHESAIVFPLPSHGERRPIIALTTRSRRNDLDAALKTVEFKREELPAARGMSGRQLLDQTQQDRHRATTELHQLKQEWESLAAEAATTVPQIEEAAGIEKCLLEAEQLFQRTETTVLLTGWIPAESATALGKCLHDCTGGRCVVELTPPTDFPEEEVPILLRSSRMLRPFETLVSAYGLPKYRELAPTLFVAASFTLMFGMMFGDVGHGSLLMLAGAMLLSMRRLARFRDFGTLLTCNGFSSVCFGALYGSYFGIPQLKEHALWRDPIEGDPMGLMLVAMGIGLTLMSLGLILNIANQLRRGNFVSGVLDRFGLMGLVFLWGSIVLAANSTAIQAQGWWTLALVLFLGVPIICWALKEPLQMALDRRKNDGALSHTLLATIPESLVGAFEGGLLYLANSISFVRLAAYAMSHAALLMATFSLAIEMERLPTVGAFLGMVVIVLGNLLAMVLEGVVASVQALRLEYYEFFGKFFSGEGQPFKPFCLAASSG